MAISESKLKLLQSERLTEFADGGGRMTGNEIVDGQTNNLFDDISDLDRVYGRVSLRKFFASVETDNTDTYLGAHLIVTDPPDDDSVNVTLFSTGSWTDVRANARDKIESYYIQGPEARWVLFGSHLAGQRQLRLYSYSLAKDDKTPSSDWVSAAPQSGDVYLLRIEGSGYTVQSQYVRVSKIASHEVIKYTEVISGTSYDFFRDVVMVEIAAPLRYDFPGQPSPVRDSKHSSPTIFRDTLVADAAQYFGVKKVTAPVSSGDLEINIGTPFAALVPSARAETPLVDIVAGALSSPMLQCGDTGSLTYSGSVTADAARTVTRYLGMGFCRSSLAVTLPGGSQLKDDGRGNIVTATAAATAYTGTCEYESGRVTIVGPGAWSGTLAIAATPAVAVANNAHSYAIPITSTNRQYNYTPNLQPVPQPGSLAVDFMSLGKWYRLIDDANGKLVSDTSAGSGTVDYATGSCVVTLTAFPDFNSSIVFNWGQPDAVHNLGGQESEATDVPMLALNSGAAPLKAGAVTVSWTVSAAPVSLTDDGAGGFAGAGGSGTIDYGSGAINIAPNSYPDPGSQLSLSYDVHPETPVSGSGTIASGLVSIDLADQIEPKTLSLTLSAGAVLHYVETTGAAPTGVAVTTSYAIADNGSAGLVFIKPGKAFKFKGRKTTAGTDSFALAPDVIPGSVVIKLKVPTGGKAIKVTYNDKAAPGTLALISTSSPSHGTTVSLNDATGVLQVSGVNGTVVAVSYRTSTVRVAISGATVNYATGAIAIPASQLVASVPYYFTATSYSGATATTTGSWKEAVGPSRNGDAFSYDGSYAGEATAVTESAGVSVPPLSIALFPDLTHPVLPGSVRFSMGASVYVDRDGVIVKDVSAVTNLGTVAGTIDYATGRVQLTSVSGSIPAFTVSSLATFEGDWTTTETFFRTPSIPVAVGSFSVRARRVIRQAATDVFALGSLPGTRPPVGSSVAIYGTDLITGSVDVNGTISGTWVRGHIDWDSGAAWIKFGAWATVADGGWALSEVPFANAEAHPTDATLRWQPTLVLPSSILYNTVLISYIPLDGDLLGIDTVRLPTDGRVTLFRTGNVAVLHNTVRQQIGDGSGTAGSMPLVGSKTKLGDAGRTRLAYAKLFDATGAAVPTSRYVTDLDTGHLWFVTPVDVTGLVGPLTCEHRIEDRALVQDVQITGQIQLLRPVSHDFPADTSYLSSALLIGDMKSRVDTVFDQQTWTNTWADTVSGSAAGASYNQTIYPIEVSNAGAIEERWAIVFSGTLNFICIGEYSGALETPGHINADYAPINPNTGRPYFILWAAGWGSGWQSGNVLRFNTRGANVPAWLARTTLMSDPYAGAGASVAAHVSVLFDQPTWYGMWADQRYGADADGFFDHVTYPFTCGAGTIRERWALIFVDATTYHVHAESIGRLTSSPINISADYGPVNTAASAPYWTLDHRAFQTLGTPSGGGGSLVIAVGTVVRFNTIPTATQPVDQFRLQIRGSAN
jgi:hypothetical protein